jgi:hypothetical protein
MYLSPLAKEKQRLSSPINANKERQAMNANQRLGHPSSGLHNQNAHLKKPDIFEVPKSEHLNPATGFANCVVTRVGSKNLYHFSHQVGGTETVSMIGNKLSKAISVTCLLQILPSTLNNRFHHQETSRTSNYHIFDAERGGMNAKLSKKSGHYIGKLRHDKDKPAGCYTLYNASREKQEMAAFVYDIPSLTQQVKEGQPPRKMQAIVPKSSTATSGKENSTRSSINYQAANANRLIEHLHNGTWKHQKLVALQTKPPKFHEGELI